MRARHASIEKRYGGHGRAAAGGGMAGLGVDDSAGLTETGHREYGLRLVSGVGERDVQIDVCGCASLAEERGVRQCGCV